ncbi:MAG: hypothetical protein DRQ48_02515 [Gammaproteobacteria bacterium]|nr:MAG: hypothetical protein DRQ48_02515 [Gammaproteobacteria bacterium]
MSKDTKQTPVELARTATEEAVKYGENISAEVRDITIEALRRHQLDLEHIKAVTRAVLEGAEDAAKLNSDRMKDTLKQVTEGLDEALGKSAYASKLAIEETAGRIKDFSEHDLKRATDDLSALEGIFIESLNEVANSSKTVASDTLQDLANHFKNSGTAVGQQAREEIINLSKQIEKTGMENMAAVSEATKSFTEDIARAASGFLDGIADSIKETKKENQANKKED